MLLHIWKAVPYNMVIFIAGLVGISRDLYDASNVDGANWWNRLRYVTLPGMIPALSVVLMLSFIRGFRVFAEVYATTGGGPSNATEMIMTHIYNWALSSLIMVMPLRCLSCYLHSLWC